MRLTHILNRERKTPLSILTAAGLVQVGHSKLRWSGMIVDIVHPDLPRINSVNRFFLEYCLVSQRPLLIASSDGTVSSLPCPTTFALLALKLYSVTLFAAGVSSKVLCPASGTFGPGPTASVPAAWRYDGPRRSGR